MMPSEAVVVNGLFVVEHQFCNFSRSFAFNFTYFVTRLNHPNPIVAGVVALHEKQLDLLVFELQPIFPPESKQSTLPGQFHTRLTMGHF